MSEPYPTIPRGDIVLGRPIGRGARGSVFEATWRGEKRVAVKHVLDHVELEASMLHKLAHPNIIKFFGASEPPESYIVIGELEGFFVKGKSCWRLIFFFFFFFRFLPFFFFSFLSFFRIG